MCVVIIVVQTFIIILLLTKKMPIEEKMKRNAYLTYDMTDEEKFEYIVKKFDYNRDEIAVILGHKSFRTVNRLRPHNKLQFFEKFVKIWEYIMPEIIKTLAYENCQSKGDPSPEPS